MKLRQAGGVLAVLMATLMAAAPAVAQWAWKDANNRSVYSDQPPPASVPPARIFKAPPGQLRDLRRELNAPAVPAAAQPAPGKAAPTTAERNAAYEQRRGAAAEQAQKDAEAARVASANAANCDNIRHNQRALASGERISNFDRNGERVFLTDAQRAEQAGRNAAMLAEHCR